MIASMHGNAVGFGFELALQCDYRIVATDCVVALPEARIGMIPAGGATQTLPRVVGSSAALHAVLTGERCRFENVPDEILGYVLQTSKFLWILQVRRPTGQFDHEPCEHRPPIGMCGEQRRSFLKECDQGRGRFVRGVEMTAPDRLPLR